MTAYRGRFAPSPTGPLHFGSLVAAVGSWLFARAAGGTWIVRVEDIDPPREVAGVAADILRTLDAFALVSDEPVMFQSTRRDAYARALAQLQERGLAFECRCSRSDLELLGGIHPAQCPSLPGERAPAWRARVPDARVGFNDALQGHYAQDLARDVGAFVVQRVEGYFAYQLAVVVDDAAQAISHVVRGADLLDSTPRQIWLQQRLGHPTPGYAHLPLALDAQGRKLSKQDGSRAVDRTDPLPALRAALQFLGFPATLVATSMSAEKLLQSVILHFDPERIPRSAAATAQA
jgi:glutamyl-Q tRNA(Asp) synthetase